MNRLTQKDLRRNIVEIVGSEDCYCGNYCGECLECKLQYALAKLAAYEDIGMDPEEISKMLHMTLDKALEEYKTKHPDFSNEFANYVGTYDAICILKNNGILDEEEVQVCEHNLLFQIIQMMHGSILKEGRTEA